MDIASKQNKELKRAARYEAGRLKKQKRLQNRKPQVYLIALRVLIGILFIISFIAVERSYNATIIHLQSVLLIGFIPGAIITFVFVRRPVNYLYGIVCFGYIFLWLFFLINESTQTKTFKVRQHIDSRSRYHHHRIHPWVSVYYANLDKDIHITTGDDIAFNRSTHLVLTLRKGFFGYFIIESQQLD